MLNEPPVRKTQGKKKTGQRFWNDVLMSVLIFSFNLQNRFLFFSLWPSAPERLSYVVLKPEDIRIWKLEGNQKRKFSVQEVFPHVFLFIMLPQPEAVAKSPSSSRRFFCSRLSLSLAAIGPPHHLFWCRMLLSPALVQCSSSHPGFVH